MGPCSSRFTEHPGECDMSGLNTEASHSYSLNLGSVQIHLLAPCRAQKQWAHGVSVVGSGRAPPRCRPCTGGRGRAGCHHLSPTGPGAGGSPLCSAPMVSCRLTSHLTSRARHLHNPRSCFLKSSKSEWIWPSRKFRINFVEIAEARRQGSCAVEADTRHPAFPDWRFAPGYPTSVKNKLSGSLWAVSTAPRMEGWV